MNGGLVGTIAEIYETEFKLEVEKSTFVRVSRAMVATKVLGSSPVAAEKKAPTKRNKTSTSTKK
jgi:preprotein translocase subunit YajC